MDMNIVIIPGDGIGPETMQVSVELLDTVNAQFGLGLQLSHDIAGHDSLRQHGATVTQALLDKVKAADGLLLGPMATYDFKDESKGEINPSKFFRKNLDLYANIRPAKTYDGIKTLTGPFDLVVVRENTEGFYADRNMALGHSEFLVTDDVAISMRRITRGSPWCTKPMCCASRMACSYKPVPMWAKTFPMWRWMTSLLTP
jgi:3-isopropylmalate dehydrogenase